MRNFIQTALRIWQNLPRKNGGGPEIAVGFARLPLRVRREAVYRVEFEGDERYPSEREVAEQNSGDGDHLQLLLNDVATRGVRVATQSLANMRDRYHLQQYAQPLQMHTASAASWVAHQ